MEKSMKNRLTTRPLTNNEKFLLKALAIVLIIWASFRFVLTPQAAKIENLSDNMSQYEQQIINNNASLRMEGKIKEEWEDLHMQREKVLSNYFPILDQSQIIYLLNDLLQEDDIEINELVFDRPSLESIQDFEVNKMEIKIPFVSSFDGIKNIMNSLETSPRKILVNSLSLDKKDESNLSGNMNLKIYSLEDIAEADPNIILVEGVNNWELRTPFESYADYDDSHYSNTETDTEHLAGDEATNIVDLINPDGKENRKSILLEDFEQDNYEFIPSNSWVKGSASPSTTKKSGEYSLRFEYNILSIEEENRAYVDLLKEGMILKYPPNSIGMWVFSYGYSPGTLGMRLTGQTGEEVDVKISEGIPWMGWSYMEINLPEDLKLYPLKVDKLYFEIAKNRNDSGVLLIDKIEAFYPLDKEGYTEEMGGGFNE